jgi:addiction module RelE/StbE family toxin
VTVRWSQRALSDAAGIYAYIAADNEDSAAQVADRLYAAGEGLARFPLIGRPSRFVGRRELVVDQYVLTYAIRLREVHVLAIEHGARRRA